MGEVYKAPDERLNRLVAIKRARTRCILNRKLTPSRRSATQAGRLAINFSAFHKVVANRVADKVSDRMQIQLLHEVGAV
jgi:hypothetical protein